MISLDEILHGKILKDQTAEIQANIPILLAKVNAVRALWGKPMTVTSTIRTQAEQIEIYRKKGITDIKKIPMNSKHIHGAAVDIADPDLALTKWLKANPKVLEDNDLYCEEGNANWVHFQILPFGSYKPGGTRWFNP